MNTFVKVLLRSRNAQVDFEDNQRAHEKLPEHKGNSDSGSENLAAQMELEGPMQNLQNHRDFLEGFVVRHRTRRKTQNGSSQRKQRTLRELEGEAWSIEL